MAPERKYPYMDKKEMIDAIQKVATELGRSPSQADMRRAGVPWHRIYNQFGGMRQAVRAAGLEPGPRGEALNEGAMILDWAGVVRRMRRMPSRAEYDRLGKHHSGTLHARLDWSQMAHRFVLLVREFHVEEEWTDVVAIVVKRYPLLKSARSGDPVIGRSGDLKTGLPVIDTDDTDQDLESRDAESTGEDDVAPAWILRMGLRRVAAGVLAIQMLMSMAAKGATGGWELAVRASTQQSALSIQPLNSVVAGEKKDNAHVGDPGAVPHKSVKEPVVYGTPLALAAMAHAPTNESGVMFLFGVLAERLRFRIERIQTAFPDCEAKKEVRPGVWELQSLEMEFESRNFKEHGHDPKGCDGIVCWRHNWPECPRWLEVIELSRFV